MATVTHTFNPAGKSFTQRTQAFLHDVKTNYNLTIRTDSGRTVKWQTTHHVIHMFLYNRYRTTIPRHTNPNSRTISWTHFQDPTIAWSKINQLDFLMTKSNTRPIKLGNSWKKGFEPDEHATTQYLKSLQIKAGIGDRGKAMVSAGLSPCGAPCRCGAGRSKHLANRAIDLNTADLNKLSSLLQQSSAGNLDKYLQNFGLHRPLNNHPTSPEPWHIESL